MSIILISLNLSTNIICPRTVKNFKLPFFCALWAAILALREAFRPVLSTGLTKGVYSLTATFRQTLTVDIVQVLSICVTHTSFSTSVQDLASIVVQSGVEVHRFSQSIVHLGTDMVLHLSSETNEHLEVRTDQRDIN